MISSLPNQQLVLRPSLAFWSCWAARARAHMMTALTSSLCLVEFSSFAALNLEQRVTPNKLLKNSNIKKIHTKKNLSAFSIFLMQARPTRSSKVFALQPPGQQNYLVYAIRPSKYRRNPVVSGTIPKEQAPWLVPSWSKCGCGFHTGGLLAPSVLCQVM